MIGLGLGLTQAAARFRRRGVALVLHALIAVGGIMQGVKKGIGDLTTTHASSLHAPDHEGVHREFTTNEAVWKGGREAKNYLLDFGSPLNSPDDFTDASDLNAGITYDSANKESTLTVQNPSGDSYVRYSKGVTQSMFKQGDQTTMSLRVKGVGDSVGKAVYLVSESSLDTHTPEPVTLTSAYRRITFQRPAKLNSNGEYIYIALRVGTDATMLEGEQVIVKGAQYEKVNGQAITVPAEEIETKEVFSHANGNIVVDNVVTEAKGADFSPAPTLQASPAGTNDQIYSRDLTNAEWTANNITPTYTSEGIDGAPIGSTRLVATAANGTVIANAVTAGSATHATVWYIKRITGTGNIDVTLDGGATWNTLATAADFKQFPIDQAALTNPRKGIRIVTSGDAVDVGNAELHLNKTLAQVRNLPPIFTSGAPASINATDYYFDAANHPAEGGHFIEWTAEYATSEVSGDIEIISLDNNAGLLYYDADTSQLKSTDGTNTASVALTTVAGTTYKIWVAYGGTSLQVGVDASAGAVVSYDGAFASGTKIEVCTPAVGVNQIRNMQAHETSFDDAVSILQALAA